MAHSVTNRCHTPEGHNEKEDQCAAFGDQDREINSDRGALKMMKNSARFLIGPTCRLIG
jgi:hypothetical protein